MPNPKSRKLLLGGGIPWYLAGGVPSQNVLGAWQPKGAASYAASKISLVNPSAANLLTDGVAFPAWAAATGWTFTAALSQYLTIASAIATAVPISMVCRFLANDVASAYALISICDTAAPGYYCMQIRGDIVGDPIRSSVTAAPGTLADSTTGYTAATWYTACSIFESAISRAAFINGGSKGANIVNVSAAGLDTTVIGAQYAAAVLQAFLDGKISACALYNIPLFDAQVLATYNAMVAAGL